MIEMLPEMNNGRPDEFEVMVVYAKGCRWESYGIYESRQKASEAVDSINKERVRAIAIKPQISDLRPFQTHPMQEVWRAGCR